eukprot:Em0011g86a
MSRMAGASGGSGARFGTGFTGGINTFWSCNKAGAIPHFTEHIKSNPRHFDKAVHDLQTAASVGSPCESSLPTLNWKSVCHIELGFAHLQLNHVQEAKQCFEKAVDLNPVLTDSNAGFALIYEHDRNYTLKQNRTGKIYRNSVEPKEQGGGSGVSDSDGSGSGGSGNDGSGIGPLFSQWSLADKDDSLKIPNEEIARVYVARRPLGGLKSLLLKYRLLAHSAVILKRRIISLNIWATLKKIELNVVHTQEKGKPHQVG